MLAVAVLNPLVSYSSSQLNGRLWSKADLYVPDDLNVRYREKQPFGSRTHDRSDAGCN